MTTIKVTCSVCDGECFIENEAGTDAIPCFKCGATGKVEIDCPDCGGGGEVEIQTGLTYDGAQTWRVEPCPTCRMDDLIDMRYRRAIRHLGEINKYWMELEQ